MDAVVCSAAAGVYGLTILDVLVIPSGNSLLSAPWGGGTQCRFRSCFHYSWYYGLSMCSEFMVTDVGYMHTLAFRVMILLHGNG